MEHSLFLLHWYGPFTSQNELKEWEKEREADEESPSCFLYLIRGREKYKRKDTYYCGKAYAQYVWQRLGNANHHIHDFEGRPHEIWVASFLSTSEPEEWEVNVCENLLTAVLVQKKLNSDYTANATNYKAPIISMSILNEWCFPNGRKRKKVSADSPADRIPDVIIYDKEAKTLKCSDKLHDYGTLD